MFTQLFQWQQHCNQSNLQLIQGFLPFPEKAMAPHPSTLAWKIPWAEEPGRLQSMGSQRVGHDWAISPSLFTFMHWRRKWQPTPGFLPGEPQGKGGGPGGLPSMGLHRVGHDWSDFAAAAAFLAFPSQFCFLEHTAPLPCLLYKNVLYTCLQLWVVLFFFFGGSFLLLLWLYPSCYISHLVFSSIHSENTSRGAAMCSQEGVKWM